MTLASQIQIKYLLPLLVFGFAITVVLLVYFENRSAVVAQINRSAGTEVATGLNDLQVVFQPYHQNQDIEGIRRLVAAFSTEPGRRILFYGDHNGRILVSPTGDGIREFWNKLADTLDRRTVRRVLERRMPEIVVMPRQRKIIGYGVVCSDSSQPETAHPPPCGILYFRKNLELRQRLALSAIRDKALIDGAIVAIVALMLSLFLHFFLTRRVEQLVSGSERFSRGELDWRTRLPGTDELAALSRSMDAMFDVIVANHKQIKHSEQRLKGILETATDGIISVDSQGMIESVNSATEQIFGYCRGEMVGHNVKMLMPQPDSGQHDHYMRRYRETGRKKIIGVGREVTGLRKDGSVFPMELAVSELVSRDSVSFTGIVRDVSLRKQAEDQLRMQEEELRLTFDFAPIGIVTCDLQRRIVRVNRAGTEMLGHTAEALLQKNFADYVYSADQPAFLDLIARAGTDQPTRQGIPMRLQCGSEEILHGVLHVGVIHSESDEPTMYVIQVEDYTERVRAESEASRLRERLAHVGRISLLGEMVAGIAHEINQPLTAIASYTDACQRLISSGLTDSDEVMSALKKAGSQAHRAGEVIRRLRGFAKRRETARIVVDVNQLVRDIVDLAHLDSPGTRCPVEMDLCGDAVAVNADPVQIQQVILNLIRNAMDAARQCPEHDQTVRVRTLCRDADLVRIEVTDHGEGVSEEVGLELFSTFFSTKPTGMGMGLSICRSIAESHGGQVGFRNNPEGGACFYLTLPVETGEAIEQL